MSRSASCLPLAGFLLLLVSVGCSNPVSPSVTVGSKAFTESAILGEVVAQLIEAQGATAVRRLRIGGTRATWDALISGEVDAYVEYTGTLQRELLTDRPVSDEASLPAVLESLGLAISQPIGFDDSYAIGMRAAVAEARGIRTISDLRDHPDLNVRLSTDFFNSPDGWSALKARYNLPFDDVTHAPHSQVYGPLSRNEIQVTDLYTTDAEIEHYALRALEDDLGHFPTYEAVLLYRQDLARSAPAVISGLRRLEGRITTAQMIALNARVSLRGEDLASVAGSVVERVSGP